MNMIYEIDRSALGHGHLQRADRHRILHHRCEHPCRRRAGPVDGGGQHKQANSSSRKSCATSMASPTTDYDTGQIKVALVRDDYNIATLPVVDERGADRHVPVLRADRGRTRRTPSRSVPRPRPEPPSASSSTKTSPTFQRAAGRSKRRVRLLGISNAAAANRIAARVLQTVAPLSRITFNGIAL